MPASASADGPRRQAEEAMRAGAPVSRQRDAGKDERQRRAGDGKPGGEKLQHRGPALRREAGEGVHAERLRERRRELDDERELQDDERGEIERAKHERAEHGGSPDGWPNI